MNIYSFYEVKNIENTVICLGDFDGVHKGHRRVFETAKSCGKWGVLLFLYNSKDEPALTTLNEKVEIIDKLGADYLITADFKKDIKNKSPEEFVNYLEKLKIKAVAVGYDYRFGKNAAGDVKLLEKLCAKKDIEVKVADAVTNNGITVKSTKIRELIKKGDLESATYFLSDGYIISGKVVKGFGNGRKLGVPTANIDVAKDKLLLPDGVYKGAMGKYNALINIGNNPTFNGQNKTVEVHLTDFDGNLYGEKITVKITEKIRDEIKFNSINELKEQIKKDIEFIKGGNKNG